MGRLEGKVAIITGAASGIGEAAVRKFIDEGARVVGGDLQEAKGQALAEALGPAFHCLPCDVAREDEVKALIDAASAPSGASTASLIMRALAASAARSKPSPSTSATAAPWTPC